MRVRWWTPCRSIGIGLTPGGRRLLLDRLWGSVDRRLLHGGKLADIVCEVVGMGIGGRGDVDVVPV